MFIVVLLIFIEFQFNSANGFVIFCCHKTERNIIFLSLICFSRLQKLY